MRASILLSCLAGLAGVTATAPVCILGAGPSGLASALRLAEKGITDVVIFDKKDGPGGKAENWVSPEGYIHQVGAIFGDTTMYPLVIDLTDKFNISRPSNPMRKNYVYDAPSGTILDSTTFPTNATAIAGAIQRYMGVYAKYAPYLVPGFKKGVPPAIAVPMSEFLPAHGLDALMPLFHLYITTFGYGSLEDIPALYAMMYYKPGGFLQFLTKQSSLFTVNYNLLFTKIAASLHCAQFKYNATITGTNRRSNGASITYTVNGKGPQTQACTSIINTIPHRLDLLQPLGLDAQEVDVFKHVNSVQYFSSVWTLDQVEPRNWYAAQLKPTGNASAPFTVGGSLDNGAPVIFGTQLSDDKYFNVYSYKRGQDPISLETVTAMAQDALSKLNKNISVPNAVAKPVQVADLKFAKAWTYFAHVNSSAIANGWFPSLEKLQGHRSTYHTGSMRCMETVECSIASANDLVDTFFTKAH
ncbi:hypothetical protein SDRG_14515 [Saprolegnia diclina VS20]|uniref:Amine oxidase domain-containing protein n=1 Tax=Saprolegnia diclina (strain VS20) TaxID=1156394 RepID=T0PZT8_SAPDV|nr:hypothetical protein SDRG_14515 [Saprolegnia diclina VS20]EQC27766.1 hypothetical protein SDRG_14515 [Saprolegnia diclina VS20]|eukprot:XP_008618871.1 hypothetical protein SDRG_14515 [Saprolegnia diclina VS20]